MQKKVVIGIVVALALAVVAIFFAFSGYQGLFTRSAIDSMDTLNQLVVQDVVVGQGGEAVPGARVRVHYVGTLQSGQKFDSSIDRGQPIEFVLGSGQVIPGWEQGIRGMKVGGKRVLIIPPSLGYGSQAYGPIPADSVLIFEVELVEIVQ